MAWCWSPSLSPRPLGCPSVTQMFHLQSNAAFLKSNPWSLARPPQKYLQSGESCGTCAQLRLNICQILSSSGRNKAEECAGDYAAHKQEVTGKHKHLETLKEGKIFTERTFHCLIILSHTLFLLNPWDQVPNLP